MRTNYTIYELSSKCDPDDMFIKHASS